MKLLLVDDHEMVRLGLKSFLSMPIRMGQASLRGEKMGKKGWSWS